MRWKIIVVTILFLILAGGATVGWIQWQSKQRVAKVEQDLAICKSQIEQGDSKKAQGNLEKILGENPRIRNADEIWALLAESYESTGPANKAIEAWEKIRIEFPASKNMPRAMAAHARDLAAKGKQKEATEEWNKIIAQYKGDPLCAEGMAGKAQMLLDQDDLAGAKDLAKKALAEYPDAPAKSKVEDIIGKVNSQLLYNGAQLEGTEIYTLARGDKLEKLGKKFNVSPDLIKRVNRLNPHNLVVGRRIKIPKTNFSMVVDKTNNTLTLYNNKEFFKRYTVRTGSEDYRTPVGDFTIESKVMNPPWNNPVTRQRIPPNDPTNELGTRWMAFSGSLGIHGTIHPETIGKYASNGCVGMSMADVEELYDLVPLYTPIKIIGKMKTSAQASK